MGNKACKKCGETKSKSMFARDKSKADGLCTVCKDCRREYRKAYYAERADEAKKAAMKWYAENKQAASKTRKQYREKNLEKLKGARKEKYWKDPQSAKEYNRNYMRERARHDPIYRLRLRARKRLWEAIKKKGYSKNSRSFDMIGCSVAHLVQHLEAQFQDGMTWDNYGKWHVDHIVPLASAKSEGELLALFHYSNLQPLWASDNIAKSARIVSGNNKIAA